ncbi:unnamed protein product [Sphagnum balticum]
MGGLAIIERLEGAIGVVEGEGVAAVLVQGKGGEGKGAVAFDFAGDELSPLGGGGAGNLAEADEGVDVIAEVTLGVERLIECAFGGEFKGGAGGHVLEAIFALEEWGFAGTGVVLSLYELADAEGGALVLLCLARTWRFSGASNAGEHDNEARNYRLLLSAYSDNLGNYMYSHRDCLSELEFPNRIKLNREEQTQLAYNFDRISKAQSKIVKEALFRKSSTRRSYAMFASEYQEGFQN